MRCFNASYRRVTRVSLVWSAYLAPRGSRSNRHTPYDVKRYLLLPGRFPARHKSRMQKWALGRTTQQMGGDNKYVKGSGWSVLGETLEMASRWQGEVMSRANSPMALRPRVSKAASNAVGGGKKRR